MITMMRNIRITFNVGKNNNNNNGNKPAAKWLTTETISNTKH